MSEFTKEQIKIIGDFEDFSPIIEKDFLTQPYADTLINHYTSASGLLGIISNQNLRFTEYAYLNDNTEGTYIFDFLEQYLQKNKYIYPKNFINALLRQIDRPPYNEIYDINCMYYFLCCFSSNSDSLPMWNYYTKTPSKAGYNIQFTYRSLHNAIFDLHCSNDGLWFEGYKVMYLPKEQETFLHKLLEYALKVWEQERSDFVIRVVLNYLNSVRFAFKHFAFEPEQEFRFVIKMDSNFYHSAIKSEKNNPIKFCDRDGIVVPYLEVPFSKNDVQAIKLSPLIKEDAALDSIELLLDKYKYKHSIKVNRSTIPLKY